MLASIRILDHFVEELHFEVNSRVFDNEHSQDIAGTISVKAEWSDPAALEGESDERYTLRVSVKLDPLPDQDVWVYKAHLRVAGLFSRKHLPPGSEMAPVQYSKISVASSISILYGLARQILSDLTAATPFKKFVLPSIDPRILTSAVPGQEAQLFDEE